MISPEDTRTVGKPIGGDLVPTATSYRSWHVHASSLAPVPGRPEYGLAPGRPLCDAAETNIRKRGMQVTCSRCTEIMGQEGLVLAVESL